MKKICAKIMFLICIGIVFASSMGYAGTTKLISISSDGVQGDNDSNSYPAISADGRYVVFESIASNLILDDINGFYDDIFIRDRLTGTTECVSISSAGVQGNNASWSPSISADGRFVAFCSLANNLVSNDSNGKYDVFVRDMQTGITDLISISSDGVKGNKESIYPSISSDGRFVAFQSSANNLILGDTNNQQDIFIHDLQTGFTERVSISSVGVQANDSSAFPSISSDGRVVAFYSKASNLVSNDTNGFFDVFVHDMQTGNTERVSVSSAGVQGNGGSYSFPQSLSADGRFVTFESYASNLIYGVTTPNDSIYVHDRQTGITKCVDNKGGSSWPSISADGRFVAFESFTDNPEVGDTNGKYDIFVYDRQTGDTKLVSVSSDGEQSNDGSYFSKISADGRFILFDTIASNLVSGDTNGYKDIFIRQMDSSNVHGSVELQNYSGDITNVPVIIELGNGIDPITLNLNSEGKFSILDVPNGTYNIRIKASHWLAKSITGVNVIDTTTIAKITLLNGDVEDNNEVDFSDINAVRAAYGSFPGDETWNERADVDGSGEVDFTDINIVRSNYGEIGD